MDAKQIQTLTAALGKEIAALQPTLCLDTDATPWQDQYVSLQPLREDSEPIPIGTGDCDLDALLPNSTISIRPSGLFPENRDDVWDNVVEQLDKALAKVPVTVTLVNDDLTIQLQQITDPDELNQACALLHCRSANGVIDDDSTSAHYLEDLLPEDALDRVKQSITWPANEPA